MSASGTSSIPAWQTSADVVVLGSGAAGLTTALVAAERGVSVLVLEKAPKIGGTSAKSGGGVWVPLNHHMAEVGVDDDRDEVLAYLRDAALGAIDDEMIVTLVDRGAEMIRFLEDAGAIEFRSWPSIGGTIDYRPDEHGARHGGRTLDGGHIDLNELGEWADRLGGDVPQFAEPYDKLNYYRERAHLRHMTPPPPPAASDGSVPRYVANGAALVAKLLKGCLERGVRFELSCRARELASIDGRIVGVRAETERGALDIRADRGVVITTGGFGWNERMKSAFLPRPMTHTCEALECEGDGHLMGMAVGADLGNMDAWWSPFFELGTSPDGQTLTTMSRAERALPHSLIVNSSGRRFCNEATNYYDFNQAFGTRQSGLKNLPAWLIVDAQFRSKYPLVTAPPPDSGLPDPDWLISAPTIAELAARIGIDGDALEQTIDEFNAAAREGVDHAFGRGTSRWDLAWGDPANEPNPSLGPLEKGPFYAARIHSGSLGTKGGLRINAAGQVMSALRDKPIPGLYAAGNAASCAVPHVYPGPGATLGAAMTFAYLIALDLTTEPTGVGSAE